MIEERNREATFYYLTKNPEYYGRFIEDDRVITLDGEVFPPNLQLGCTIETDIDENYRKISTASLPSDRFTAMKQLRAHTDNDILIYIEPIIKFDLDNFVQQLKEINPQMVAIGRDNYNNSLPEPSPKEFDALCGELTKFTEVFRK
jgi:hypothetical protein